MSKFNELSIKAYVKMMGLLNQEEGEVNIVATVLLIGIAVVLAIAFKDKIVELLGKLFDGMDTNSVNSSVTI